MGWFQFPIILENPMRNAYTGWIENMPHIYSCEKLNDRKPVFPFEKVNNGSLSEQSEIFQRFEQNMNKRSELKQMIKEDRNET